MERPAIYCQSCGKVNSLRDTHCRECGTRLLIVVFPNSLQYDTNQVPSFYEDHLLERVTFLELKLAQVLEKLQMTYELFSRETDEFKKDHVMINAFLKTLDEYDPQLSELFKQKQTQIYEKNSKKLAENEKRELLFDEVLAEHTNPNGELFKHILSHGIKLLDEDEKQAFQMLERAALLSPTNVSLHIFIAEKFFRADKFDDAKKYLERIFQHSPANLKIILLLGAIYADECEPDKARRLLSVLTENEKTALIVDFIWGMLAASEQNWTESNAAFKEALNNNNYPEIQYLIGCVYYQLNNFPQALIYLKNAVKVDTGYSDAYFMQGLIYRKLNDPANEEEFLAKARENIKAGSQCIEYLKGKKQTDFEFALPFNHLRQDGKRIFMNGALRISQFFRERIYQILDS
ncbi:MAG TPA: tetratricopeptide repeat protein [Pyrinomonadaceae bacterium]|nr:tetratricopeptide repeat protein [Pyrinomonadaceae bacterium]